MTERPGDDDELDPSDWLTSQFDETGEVKKPAQPATPPPAPPPAVTTPPAAAAPPPPAPPAEPPPPAEPAGGFSWGLQPAAAQEVPASPPAPPTPPIEPPTTPPAVTPPVAPPPASAPPVPPPLIEPPATVAMTAPPAPPAAGDVDPWDQPTQALEAMPAELAAPSLPAPAAPTPPAAPGPEPEPDPYAGIAAAELLGAASLASEPGSTSPLDALFGDENFRDYEAEPAPTQSPFARAAAEPTTDAAPGHTRITGTQRVLLAVAGGLVALLALAALFLLGTRLAGLMEPAAVATPTASATPSPSPTPTVEPVGPVAPGVWAWDELRGGECLDPYTDPWAEEFTVVDCAAPHPAQMVVRGTYPPSAEGVTDDPYPGAEVLQGQLSLLCTAPGVIDLAVAGQYPDVQFQGAYPATAEQWDEGNRFYYCFVSRSSGEPLTGSIAVAPAG